MPIENQADNQPGTDYLISYPRSFVIKTGNVSSAIFLSQLLSLSRTTTETDGWVSKSMAEWQELTGMGRNEQSAARKSLLKIDLMEENVRGMPATLCIRLKHDELARLLPEANQYAENGNLFSNLVCSPEWVGADTAESSANQFAENSKPLENKACEADSHLQTVEKKINWHTTLPRIQADFNRLESNIGVVNNKIDLLNEQGCDKETRLDRMESMLIGLIVMVFMILVLCIFIWWLQLNYQNVAPSQKALPMPTNNTPQYRR